MKPFAWIMLIIGWVVPAQAQLELEIAAPRKTFLLYETVELNITVRNTSRNVIQLANHRAPWLDFIIQADDGQNIAPDQPLQIKPARLMPGQALELRIDITPHYLIREPGTYHIQAVVQPPRGEAFLTRPLMIQISGGSPSWREERLVRGEKRIYSLWRFVDERNTLRLYLRVEEPENNRVFQTAFLGGLNPAMELPEPKFDRQGRLHILHPDSRLEYRYTVVGAAGHILKRQVFPLSPAPKLVSTNGGVDVESQ